MTERDFKILKKVSEKQNELSDMVKQYKINRPDDLSKIPPVVRRGIVAFIADLFELIKPVSDVVQTQLPFNRTFIKSFRDKSTHQYGRITNVIAHACLMHCVDKSTIDVIRKLIEGYDNPETLQTETGHKKTAKKAGNPKG